MKVALAGLGGMGSTHYNLYRMMEDVTLVALVDVERERVEGKAADCGARWYTSFSEMLEKESPDYVHIATPSYTHAELALQALSKGIPVLTEKPAALCPEDVERMYRCAEEHGAIFMAAHVIRFWPEYQWLKQAVQSGRYGSLRRLNLWRTGEKPRSSWQNWMLDPAKSGMVPYDLHIHDVDYMVSLLGLPEKVQASEIRDGETTNTIRSVYQYPQGLEVTAEAAWYSCRLPFAMGYEALFDQGLAIYREGRLTWYPNDKEPEAVAAESMEQDGLSEINVGNTQGYYNEIRYFIRCVETGAQPVMVKEQELLDTLRLIAAETKG